MKFEEWLNEVPSDIKEDAVWSLKVYRIALFTADLSWFDIKPILDEKLSSFSDLLFRSVGSISSNIAERYSRSSHKEQARFYEIALSSTREGKDWYFKSRHILSNQVSFHRIKILTSIAKLLLIEAFEIPPRPAAGFAVGRVCAVSIYPPDGLPARSSKRIGSISRKVTA